MEERTIRTAMLIGEDSVDKLRTSTVAIFGLGGVGGHATEALVRSGVGSVDLIDNDTVSESNINRQLFATYNTLGRLKTDVAEERNLSINPSCRVKKHAVFVTPEIKNEMDFSRYDFVIDAIDTVSAKIAIAEKCQNENIPLISSMGTGNKLDPTKFEISDIYKTSVCPLARVMRNELRRRGIKALKVLYSKEEPIKPIKLAEETDKKSNKPIPASISFVPSAAGLIIAGEAIKSIIK